jgi:hypothetical protein
MARLLTVVNERKKLRNEYRRHLEDEYIAQKKAEEQAAIEKDNEKRVEQGLKPMMTEKDLMEKIIKKAEKKKALLDKSFEDVQAASVS